MQNSKKSVTLEAGEKMRQVMITKLSDFETLRKMLNGSSMIEVKIGKLPKSFTIDALDLQRFKGQIDVTFLEDETPYYVKVYTSNPSSCLTIFEHTQNKKIKIKKGQAWNFKKISYQKEVKISTEEEFLSFIKNTTEKDYVAAHLMTDIVLSQVHHLVIPNFLKVVSQNYYVYLPSGSKLKKSNLQVKYYSRYIPISSPEDFQKLQDFTKGTIVAKLKTDIQNKIIPSVSLAKFQGNLILLGNNHSFQSCIIDGPGIISELSNTASLTVRDFHMNQVIVRSESDYNGAFLGTHFISPYASYTGEVLFQNCSVENSYIQKGDKNTGVFVGRYGENMYLHNCSIENVFSENKKLQKPFGMTSIYNGYYYESQKDHGPSLSLSKKS